MLLILPEYEKIVYKYLLVIIMNFSKLLTFLATNLILLKLKIGSVWADDGAGSNWPSASIKPTDGFGPEPATFGDLEVVFANILGLLIPFAGLAIFIMFIMGGYTYLTSAGNPEKTGQANKIIMWAIIGLLFLIGAWFVLLFIKEITGVNVTEFKFPGVTN